MRKLLLVGFSAFFLVSPSLALSQIVPSELYDFKGDRLGMGLDEFKTKHREPGAWFYENVCVKDKCASEKVWKPRLDCKDWSKIMICGYSSTIADVPAQVSTVFVENNLIAIRVTYLRTDLFKSVFDALTTKLGAPIASDQDRTGIFVYWDNGTSRARLQEHSCGSRLMESIEGWLDEIVFLLKAYKYPDKCIFTYRESNVIYLHRALGSAAQERMQAMIKERAAKSRSDL